MLPELASQEKAVGVKQSRKALREGRVRLVYLACDAAPAITGPIAGLCAAADVPVDGGYTMAQLGRACHIAVGASVVAVLQE